MIATLEGQTVTSLSLTVPIRGVPWADVETSSEAVLSGPVVLRVGDVSFAMTVCSAGEFAGRARYRLAGGAGKWGTEIPAQDYANDAGVKASTVALDAARLCGETIDVTGLGNARLGAHVVRVAGMASASLPAPWFVDNDGVTKFGARASGAIEVNQSEVVGRPDPSQSVLDIAPVYSMAQYVPGKTLDGAVVSDVHVYLSTNSVRVRLFAKNRNEDPTIAAFRRMVDACDPLRKYRATYEYRVVSYAGNKMNLQISRAASGMPDLQRVPVRAGVSGAKQDVELGSMVLVTFLDGDKTRPVVVGFDDPDSPGFAPKGLDLVGKDDSLLTTPMVAGRVVRYGDTVWMPTGPAATPAPYKIAPLSLEAGQSLTISRVKA